MLDQYLTSGTRASIMLVDDIPENLRLLTRYLGSHYNVRPFQSGAQALQDASANPPDLILLDIMMPGMNGFEVLEALKADPRLQEIPVIFISALDDIDTKVRAFECGGVDYVSKPFQEEEVLARIRTHLSLRDLRQRLQIANQGLSLQLNELHDRNMELDAFAHTVAHDLKNPLATIVMAAHILMESVGKIPPEQAQQELSRVIAISAKMDRILEGLMLLFGLRSQEPELELVDMGAIVNESLKSLELLVERHQAQIVMPESWPAGLGYAPWLEEVWVNYISNAIKYGGRLQERIPPRIELGFDHEADSQVGYIRYWVRDHGNGLTHSQQQQLFTPFERLHKAGLEGHGLGLSIVRRIVNKMGGQVGVESAPGQGSRFFFTLLKGD